MCILAYDRLHNTAVELCHSHAVADLVQPKNASNVTRPFPAQGLGAGNETTLLHNWYTMTLPYRPTLLVLIHWLVHCPARGWGVPLLCHRCPLVGVVPVAQSRRWWGCGIYWPSGGHEAIPAPWIAQCDPEKMQKKKFWSEHQLYYVHVSSLAIIPSSQV